MGFKKEHLIAGNERQMNAREMRKSEDLGAEEMVREVRN